MPYLILVKHQIGDAFDNVRCQLFNAGFWNTLKVAVELDLRRASRRENEIADLWVNAQHRTEDMVKHIRIDPHGRAVKCGTVRIGLRRRHIGAGRDVQNILHVNKLRLGLGAW